MSALKISGLRRGLALVMALVILATMAGLVVFLTQATLSRVRAQRAAASREGCLMRAENILARARVALEEGRLEAGKPFNVDGVSVETRASKRGVRLEVLVGPKPRKAVPAPRTTPAPKKKPGNRPKRRQRKARLRWRVRVAWELAKDPKTSRWHRVDWEARDEGDWHTHGKK